MNFKNGNAEITIYNDGTRIIEFEDQLKLDWPLNIDIRVSNRCSFGFNPKINSAFCSFCHESARTDGGECDYEILKDKLKDLPAGIELAIGGNEITGELCNFLNWASFGKRFICNLTVNQGHIYKYRFPLMTLIKFKVIKGLGISYRSSLKWNIPKEFLNYENTVFHVIAGIDSVQDILTLAERGVKKVLVLGEKNFGFNEGKVDLTTRSHKEWYRNVRKLFDTFDVVSFDNLALDQLNINRFFSNDKWSEFNQGEHSFYINAVDGYFSPSSRSNDKADWNSVSIKDYFQVKA
jgi:hypothetical protein